MNAEFSKVVIVGVGLMGGSLGLAIKRCYANIEVIGVDKEQPVLLKALEKGAIDRGCLELAEGLAGADLVFLAAPIGAILALLPEFLSLIADHALVSDLGSTKARICQAARQFLPHHFIGGHPMTGSERQGIEAADPFLFENAVYILTPSQRNPRTDEQLKRLNCFLAGLGARVLMMNPEVHDRVIAYVSHLPQLLAVTLTDLISQKSEENALYRELAAGGFRDMTRIAASPYDIWRDILLSNAETIETALDELVGQLLAIKEELKAGASGERFRRAAAFRTALPKGTKGFLRPLHRIATSVPDQPGVLARMTTAIAQAGINLKDIELLKVREGVGGTFHLYFDTLDDAQQAIERLKEVGYESNLLD